MASNFTGDYSVALQVEDFLSSTDIIPLSSVPVQFVVRVQNIISNPPCSSQPEFVGTTPSDEACIAVPFNTLWNATITARVSSSCTAHYIADFVTASPLGMKKSDLVQSSDNPGERQMNVTWTPTHSQFGPNIFCYAAVDDIG